MKIIICGDSWSGGEWSPDGTDILHGGVAEYFRIDGHDVTNLGQKGGTNLSSVTRLSNWLSLNPYDQEVFVLFFLTEFFREIWYYTNFNNQTHETSLREELARPYSVIKESWVHRPYYRLQELATKHNIKIHLIGGCSDAIVEYNDFQNDFPRLIIACQSFTNLLINNTSTIDQPVMCEFLNDWTDPFLQAVKPDEVMLKDMDLAQIRRNQFEEYPNWFYPDGIHPNRQAHHILYEHVKPCI
tara:strand:+ start:2438 stop:3163 length:726 start_codon:yes stop_codon:yes gene_type:complete